MKRCLQKFESAKIISKPVLTALFIASIVHTPLQAENALAPIPVPAKKPEHSTGPLSSQPAEPNNKAAQPKRFNGADNAPPFDLAAAKLCESKLTRRGVQFELVDPILDEKGCRAERPIKVSILSKGVTLSAPIIARCEVVHAFNEAVTKVIMPTAKIHLEKSLVQIQTSTSYQCRTRYSAKGAKISEHGFANAIDITGFQFADGSSLAVAPNGDLNEAQFLSSVRAAGCAFFTTVLGPGSNAAHDDHFHFDLAHRKGGYRLCE